MNQTCSRGNREWQRAGPKRLYASFFVAASVDEEEVRDWLQSQLVELRTRTVAFEGLLDEEELRASADET